MNNEYEEKLDMIKNLNFSENDKNQLENKIIELEDVIYLKEDDINDMKKEILLQENILKITEESIEKDYKIKELSDLVDVGKENEPELINKLNQEIEKELENSMQRCNN